MLGSTPSEAESNRYRRIALLASSWHGAPTAHSLTVCPTRLSRTRRQEPATQPAGDKSSDPRHFDFTSSTSIIIMAFDFVAGYAVFTVLQFVIITPILGYWIRSLRRVSPIQSAPLRIAHLFVRAAPPIYALGSLLGAIFGAIKTADFSGVTGMDDASYAAVFVFLVSEIFIYAADIAITMALYMSTIGSLYIVLGKATWWKTLRLDAPIGGGILLVLVLAFFGRSIHLATGTATSTAADERSLLYLPVIVDFTLLTITVGNFCTVIYVMSKLKKRGEQLTAVMGKVCFDLPHQCAHADRFRFPPCCWFRLSFGPFAARTLRPAISRRSFPTGRAMKSVPTSYCIQFSSCLSVLLCLRCSPMWCASLYGPTQR